MTDAIFRRLRMSNAELVIAIRTIDAHLRPPQLGRSQNVTNRAVYHFFRDTRDAGVDACVLALADTRAKAAMALEQGKPNGLQPMLTRLLAAYYRSGDSVVSPPRVIDGRDLMRELQLPAGPLIGEILEAIREAQAEGEVSSREQALAFARHYVAGQARTTDQDGGHTNASL